MQIPISSGFLSLANHLDLKFTFVTADVPAAASEYPMLDMTLPTSSGDGRSLQKTWLMASSSLLSASGIATIRNKLFRRSHISKLLQQMLMAAKAIDIHTVLTVINSYGITNNMHICMTFLPEPKASTYSTSFGEIPASS